MNKRNCIAVIIYFGGIILLCRLFSLAARQPVLLDNFTPPETLSTEAEITETIEEPNNYDDFEWNLEVISGYVKDYQKSIIHSTVYGNRVVYEVMDEHKADGYSSVQEWATHICVDLSNRWLEQDPDKEIIVLVLSTNDDNLITYSATNKGEK